MKIDISRVKKIRSDSKSTTLKTPDGHQFIVAHHALSPSMKKQLAELPKHYADGGEVDESDRSPASLLNPEEAQAASDKKLSISKEERAALDAVQAQEGAVSSDPVGPARPEPGILDRVNSALSLPGEQDMLAAKQWQRGIAADQAALGAAPVDAGPAPASLGPSTLAPQSAPMPVSPNYAQGMVNDVNALRSAGNQAASAASEQGRIELDAAKEQQKLLQMQQQQYQKNFAEIDQEFKNVIHDVQAQHINANHYMENMSAGKKVSTAIGLFLGGIGQGMVGGENPAQKFLGDQIQRDIDAQKANFGKQETLLSANLKRFGNLHDATQMTQAMQLGIYAAKVKEAAAHSMGPEAKLKAAQLVAEADARIAPLLQDLAQKQSLQSMISNPNASPVTKIQALPKQFQDNAIKELNEYKNIQSKLAQVAPVMREAYKNTSLSEKVANPIQSAQRRKVAFAQLFPIAKAIAGERMTDADARALIEPYLPNMTTNAKTMEQNIRKLEAQLASEASGRTPILSEYGIVPKLEATPEVKTMGGVKYQKVQGGWKKVQ